jgi:hypothetical protein
MRDVRMAALIRAIEARYPGTRSLVERFVDPMGDPDIRWRIWILNIRDRDLGHLGQFAYHLAGELYGPDPLPFYISSVGWRNTKGFLADRAARERRDRTRPHAGARRKGRTSGRPRARVARAG